MSEVSPDVLILDKGLDLQTPVVFAQKGSVTDVENYEQADLIGLRRVDGYQRYDGRVSPALNDFVVIEANSTITGSVGDYVATSRGLFGIVLAINGAEMHVAPVGVYRLPRANQNLELVDPATGTNITVTATAAYPGVDLDLNPNEHYELVLQYSQQIRDLVTDLHATPIGLHWFRDRLYAVAELHMAYVKMREVQPA